MTFREYLERELQHRTQAELAEILGVTQATISRWLTGERLPSRRLRRLFIESGVDPATL
jgi:transcriptional regulator with XRE-family HTH domain